MTQILALSGYYPFVVFFVLQFSVRSHWLTKKRLAFLLIEPVIRLC